VRDTKARLQRLRVWFPPSGGPAVITTGLVLLMGAGSGILAARLLGPSGRGVLAVAFVWLGLISQIGEPGINQALTYFASKDNRSVPLLWGQSLVVAAAQTLIVLPLAFVASRFLVASEEGKTAVTLALLGIPPSFVFGYLLSLLRGLGAFRSYNALRLLNAVGWLGIVVTFWAMGLRSVIGLLVGYLASLLVVILIAMLLLSRDSGYPRFALRGVSRLLRYGVLVWAAGIGHQANARIDQFLMGALVPAFALGNYAAAVSIAAILSVISMGVGVVTLPTIAQAVPREQRHMGRRYVLGSVVLTGAGALILGVLAPVIVPSILGSAFRPAVPLLRVLLIGQVALGATQILHEIARGMGRLRVPALIEGIGAATTVVAILYAVPRWGVMGAAWVSVAVYWPVAVFMWLSTLRPHSSGAGGLIGRSPAVSGRAEAPEE